MDVNNNPEDVCVPFKYPAYGTSRQNEDGQLPTSEELYDVIDLPVTATTNDDEEVIRAAQENFKKSSSRNSCLVLGIALYTAVLALLVAVMSVTLSTALNSKPEIQSLVKAMNDLQMSLNQSMNTIEVIGEQISALQTDTATQYGILNQLQQEVAQTQPTSCSEIPSDRPSGEYWILGNSSSVQVYCDTNRSCCNTTGGWMRVANLDMTDPNQQCPDGFLLHNETTAPLRTCGRPGPGCVLTTFPVHGIKYSRVCGRVIGYQFGRPEAFLPYYDNSALTINDGYVDGVSLTHGQSPREHIWTFACALNEVDTRGNFTCPCTRSDIMYTGDVPPFIGQDYFCDTGSKNGDQSLIFYPDDPLWNGQGCGGTSTCCTFNNPPWFCKQLPQSTTEDIELRLCANAAITNEDISLELVDIFVQ